MPHMAWDPTWMDYMAWKFEENPHNHLMSCKYYIEMNKRTTQANILKCFGANAMIESVAIIDGNVAPCSFAFIDLMGFIGSRRMNPGAANTLHLNTSIFRYN